MLSSFKNLPDFVDEFLGKDLLNDLFGTRTGVSRPSVNIVEDKESFAIEVAAPGLNKEDFKIDLENNLLTISANKEDEKKDEDEKKYMRREFCYTCFKRSFTLPNTADTDKISATHKNGVLVITIPKKEEAKEKPAQNITIE